MQERGRGHAGRRAARVVRGSMPASRGLGVPSGAEHSGRKRERSPPHIPDAAAPGRSQRQEHPRRTEGVRYREDHCQVSVSPPRLRQREACSPAVYPGEAAAACEQELPQGAHLTEQPSRAWDDPGWESVMAWAARQAPVLRGQERDQLEYFCPYCGKPLRARWDLMRKDQRGLHMASHSRMKGYGAFLAATRGGPYYATVGGGEA